MSQSASAWFEVLIEDVRGRICDELSYTALQMLARTCKAALVETRERRAMRAAFLGEPTPCPAGRYADRLLADGYVDVVVDLVVTTRRMSYPKRFMDEIGHELSLADRATFYLLHIGAWEHLVARLRVAAPWLKGTSLPELVKYTRR